MYELFINKLNSEYLKQTQAIIIYCFMENTP